MAKDKHDAKDSDAMENIEGALTRSERYIEENQKSLTIIIVVILVIFGGYYGYKNFILEPKQEEALAQMYMAEQYFETDSFRLAIEGDNNFLGFEAIIDDYGMTKAANLAHYYLGISHLNLGNFEEAIEYLKDFDSSDKIVAAISLGAIGDAYVELGELEDAISYYKRAVKYDDNSFSAPIYLFKLGLALQETGNYTQALDAFNRIQQDYPESNEARDIKKYIKQAEIQAERNS